MRFQSMAAPGLGLFVWGRERKHTQGIKLVKTPIQPNKCCRVDPANDGHAIENPFYRLDHSFQSYTKRFLGRLMEVDEYLLCIGTCSEEPRHRDKIGVKDAVISQDEIECI